MLNELFCLLLIILTRHKSTAEKSLRRIFRRLKHTVATEPITSTSTAAITNTTVDDDDNEEEGEDKMEEAGEEKEARRTLRN